MGASTVAGAILTFPIWKLSGTVATLTPSFAPIAPFSSEVSQYLRILSLFYLEFGPCFFGKKPILWSCQAIDRPVQ
jgi:hypothetical protein